MPNPADASEAAVLETAASAAPDAPDASSASAPAEGEKPGAAPDGGGKQQEGDKAPEPKTPLDVTKGVLGKEGTEAAPATEKPKEEKKPADAKDEKSTEGDEPPKDAAAWSKMRQENRTLTVARRENEKAIKELEPKAQGYDELMGFLHTNSVDREGFANALAIAAAVQNDPFKAFEMLKPIMEQLESIVGERLPADLQAKVEAGQVDLETARELARERGKRQVGETQHQRTQQRFQETQQQLEERQSREEIQRFADSVETAVRGWEKQWTSTDPDSAKKLPFVMDAIGVKLQATPPSSPEEAVKLAQSCLDEVNTRMKSILPPPAARPSHILPNGSNLPTKVVPGSPFEVVKNALRPGVAAR